MAALVLVAATLTFAGLFFFGPAPFRDRVTALVAAPTDESETKPAEEEEAATEPATASESAAEPPAPTEEDAAVPDAALHAHHRRTAGRCGR